MNRQLCERFCMLYIVYSMYGASKFLGKDEQQPG